MKLRRNLRLKAAVLGGTIGLIMALFGLVRANPQITVDAQAVEPLPDYQRFFASQASPNTDTAQAERAPHTRTRAS